MLFVFAFLFRAFFGGEESSGGEELVEAESVSPVVGEVCECDDVGDGDDITNGYFGGAHAFGGCFNVGYFEADTGVVGSGTVVTGGELQPCSRADLPFEEVIHGGGVGATSKYARVEVEYLVCIACVDGDGHAGEVAHVFRVGRAGRNALLCCRQGASDRLWGRRS